MKLTSTVSNLLNEPIGESIARLVDPNSMQSIIFIKIKYD